MTTIYRYTGEPTSGAKPAYEQFEGEVVATRPAITNPDGFRHSATAYLIVQHDGDGWQQVMYCFARKTGSYEHASWCDDAPQFRTRDEAIAYIAAKSESNGHTMQ